MTPTGVHQWLPRGRVAQVCVGVGWTLLGVWNLVDAADALDVVLAAVLLACAASLICSSPAHRVRADDQGLHVRGAWWRTKDVAWADVVDIRPRRVWWSRAEVVVVTRDGREIRTGLLAKDHEDSLVEHWGARTGRESVPAA